MIDLYALFTGTASLLELLWRVGPPSAPVLGTGLGALALLALGLFLGFSSFSAPPPRWRRPVENPHLDPLRAVQLLQDAISRSPGYTRGAVEVGGVRLAARWITAIEVRPGLSPSWTSGRWRVYVDDWSADAADLECLSQVALARLRVVQRERAAAWDERASAWRSR